MAVEHIVKLLHCFFTYPVEMSVFAHGDAELILL
jgi:hypothetical protein